MSSLPTRPDSSPRNIQTALSACVMAAVQEVFSEFAESASADIRRSQHADYQSGVALPLAKKVRRAPREIAGALAEALSAAGRDGRAPFLARVAVAGPGFLNLTLSESYLLERAGDLLVDERLGADVVAKETVVVDYSAPNVAKEMHVGHLRSTVIGDALVRIFGFAGFSVLRQNHLGDWGTPFGMLIEHLIDLGGHRGTEDAAAIGELNAFYKAARKKFDSDDAFKERARLRVVALQSGEPETLELWKKLVDVSKGYFMEIYSKLGVRLLPEDFVGESHYNPALDDVVRDLEQLELAQESQGATCLFLDGFVGREGNPLPLIVRKQDGGYGYAATDLAAIRHRVGKLGAGRILYVVGLPQAQHFAMVFAGARAAGWLPDSVAAHHVGFGSVLGKDKKVLKSRSGESVRLIELIDEATARGVAAVKARAPEISEAESARVGAQIGIGAIKYADLSNDRVKDYVFDLDRMVAFEGDTAPYLMYAHARICSILRKGGLEGGPEAVRTMPAPAELEPAERALIVQMLDLPAVIDKTVENLHPHRLCRFLFDVASAYSSFYESCPVLKAEAATRDFRLALCAATARMLALGLDLLGIEAPQRM